MKKNKLKTIGALGLSLVLGGASLVQATPLEMAQYVGVETAKTLAIAHAAIDPNTISHLYSRLQSKDGVAYYEIEFFAGNQEYDYELNATTGAIVMYDFDCENYFPGTPRLMSELASYISENQAKAIAIAHAGVNSAEITNMVHRLYFNQEVAMYEVEFWVGALEYDYEINATTGAILAYDYQVENFLPYVATQTATTTTTVAPVVTTPVVTAPVVATPVVATPTVATTATTTTHIGEAKAKSIALAHAGITESQVAYILCKLEYEKGLAEYDVEFWVGNVEYDYEINATTGAILSYDYDAEYNYKVPTTTTTPTTTPTTATSSNYIGEAKAKSIALSHAGITESQVAYILCKLEYEKGLAEYDVEFWVGNVEYDYEINATTGAILSYDYDAEYNYKVPTTTTTPTTTPTTTTSSNYIGEAKAKSIALSHAGANASAITSYKCKFEYEKGGAEYEVEWKVGRTEYEYTISATTGAILEVDIDHD
ncbi:MAG: PepSY domain-containing protein [Bacillota bacterium]